MFKSRRSLILTAALIGQLVLFYSLSHGEDVPLANDLDQFSRDLGNWRMVSESKIEDEVLAVLQANDTLTRVYQSSDGGMIASLYVAYFATQRTGVAPHSPKNCLPGSGWVQEDASIVNVDTGGGQTIESNRYIVAKGDQKTLVYYWYQTPIRTVASEYNAKFYVVADAIRYNRTDTSLVRVMVPLEKGEEESADRAAQDFIHSLYPQLKTFLPS